MGISNKSAHDAGAEDVEKPEQLFTLTPRPPRRSRFICYRLSTEYNIEFILKY